jgi:hypothetical protein
MRQKIVKLIAGAKDAVTRFDEQREQPLFCHA